MKAIVLLLSLTIISGCALISDPNFDRVSRENCEVSCETNDSDFITYSKEDGCVCSDRYE